MKIITLALNPAVDRTMYFNAVKIGALNRASAESVTVAGGKGLGNSFVLKKLGIDSKCLGFWGGNNGGLIIRGLQQEKIDYNNDMTRCESRMNIKIISENNEPTEFNESGGPILPEERELMLSRIKDSLENGAEYFFMGGSVPAGIEKSFYRDILNLGGGVKFILDCDGEALKLCMENKKKPYIIKPNQFELEQYCGKKFDLDNNFELELEKVKCELKNIYDKTGVIILCTLGGYGGLYCGGEGIYYVRAPRVEVKGFSGAGDTFLPAFCAVYFKLFDLPEGGGAETALKFAVAASAAKVKKPGTETASVDEIFELAREHNIFKTPG